MNRDDIRTFVVAGLLAILIVVTAAACLASEDVALPSGYTCEDVRKLIAEQGKVKALALALEKGLSIRQIKAIRQACKV